MINGEVMEGDIRCILNASPGWGGKMKKSNNWTYGSLSRWFC